jgi:peptide/nickel transport system permease protein
MAGRFGLRPRNGRRRTGRRKATVTFAIVWISALVVVALTVQWYPIHNYGTAVGPLNKAPNWSAEFLGTDAAGRSILSRLLYGARTSLLISVASVLLSFSIGSFLGMCSAVFKAPLSTLGEIIANTILAIPPLVLLLGIVLALGSTLSTLVLAFGVVFIPQYLRLTRAEATRQLARDYIVAARVLGASSRRIIFRELVPNTLPSLVSFTVLALPSVMIIEGGLSFLGYGVQSPTPSWGNMIALGDQYLTTMPWGSLLPCIFFGVTIFSMITIGDYLRERLAPRGAAE